MELAGEDLKTVIERNRFGLTSNKNAIRLAHRLHGAVGFLHTKNFFHRDIKAENVLIELRNRSIRVTLCDFGDASNIREPARRRSSFLNYFLPAALSPYCEAEDHCHVAVLCVKLLKDLSCIPRRRSVFWASHVTQFEFPKLEEEHQWIELIWMNLCGCVENKDTKFSFIATFLDAAVDGFDKRSDLDYNTNTGRLRLEDRDTD